MTGTAPDRAPVRVSVFDYGAGNLHSLIKALEIGGAEVRVDTNPLTVVDATDALILPGVGAFAPAAARLAPGREVMRQALLQGLPALGICLGMQLLFDGSDEGPGEGLGVVAGRVERLTSARVPQIGWNQLTGITDPLLDAAQLQVAYYANSFVCRPSGAASSCITAWSEHEGERFAAALRQHHVIGTQFHPEKSSTPGIAFIQAFLTFAASLRSRS